MLSLVIFFIYMGTQLAVPSLKLIILTQTELGLAEKLKKSQENQIVAIDKSNQQIYHYTCDDVQPMFDYNYFETESLFYRASYGIFLQATEMGKIDFQKWNSQRQIIEWGRKNIQKGDKVYYDCPNRQNLQQIAMLSKFVGPAGTLILNNFNKQNALNSLKTLYNISNIKEISDPDPRYQVYSTIITTNQVHLKKVISKGFLENKKTYKIFAYLHQLSKIVQFVEKMNKIQELQFQEIFFNQSECNNKLFSKKITGKAGFHQFKKGIFPFSTNSMDLQNFLKNQSAFINMMEKQYQSFKASRPSLKQRKDINAILSNMPVQGNKILNITKQQVSEWQNQKQIIEWVKNRTILSSHVYYEYNPKSLNLFVVLNIGVLLTKGQISVVCNKEEWKIIQKNMRILNVTTIKQLPSSSMKQAIQSNFIITNNLKIIEECLESNYSEKGKILGYFTQKKPESVNLLYTAFVRNHIKRVIIKPSFYFGYEVFDHFAWHSDHPEGFYEIQKLDYVIFSYWGGQPETLKGNRRSDIEQSIRSNGVQLKLIYSKLLPFFEIQHFPLNKAFQYLSPVHKSDYARIYLMHHYGGGYSDIKHMHFNWKPYFQRLEKEQKMWAAGYHERYTLWPTCHQQPGQTPCKQIKKHYLKIIGAGHYIHKKRSPLTSFWLNRVNQILDFKYEAIKNNPYLDARDRLGKQYWIDGKSVISTYPLRWEQINAQVYCRAQYSVLGQYFVDMPYVITKDYL